MRLGMALEGSLPREEDRFGGLSVGGSEITARALDGFGRRLGVEVKGLERLPCGGAVLVANHAFGIWEVSFIVARIRVQTGRVVRSLGEHLWWRVPVLRRFASAMGVVDGTPENAERLLREGELVLVLPGGLREALKPAALRYRLLWGHRYGFVRAALRAGVPLVPIACVGGEDLLELSGNAYERAHRFHMPIPIPIPAHLPHRARLSAIIGDPIPVTNRGSADDDSAVKSLRREVEGELHELLEEELACRAGFPYGR